MMREKGYQKVISSLPCFSEKGYMDPCGGLVLWWKGCDLHVLSGDTELSVLCINRGKLFLRGPTHFPRVLTVHVVKFQS